MHANPVTTEFWHFYPDSRALGPGLPGAVGNKATLCKPFINQPGPRPYLPRTMAITWAASSVAAFSWICGR